MRVFLILLATLLAALTATASAVAHPHAWITVSTTIIVNEMNEATAIRERWVFDKMYSFYALDDFDPNKNGKIDPEELVQLAHENLNNLKAYNYFTVFEDSKGQPIAMGDYRDVASYLQKAETNAKVDSNSANITETVTRMPNGTTRFTQDRIIDTQVKHANTDQIVMEFTVPLASPQKLDHQGVVYRIYDPTYYTDMTHRTQEPIDFISAKDSAALTNCKAKIELPKVDTAMLFNAAALDKNATAPKDFGYYFSEKVMLTCSAPN